MPERPKRISADYGDFTEYQIRTLQANYVREFTLGLVGWGVDFINWLEIKHDIIHTGMFSLKKPSETKPRSYQEIYASEIIAMRYDGSNGKKIIEMANGLAWYRGDELLIKSSIGGVSTLLGEGDWFIILECGSIKSLSNEQFKEEYYTP
jgi:hypothetical protein